MTQKVDPSPGEKADSYRNAYANRYGALNDGWIVDTNTDLLATHEGLSGAPLNAFAETHSSSSFDVTIDTGEAFVQGSWLAKDTTTTVTLASSTNNQTVYLGWSESAASSVIIGKSAAFGADDPKVEIWVFDTDGSGVTSATDKRSIGQQISVINEKYDSDASGLVDDAEDAQALSSRGPDVVFRDKITISLGVAKLDDTEQYRQIDWAPSNTTWKLLGVSLMDDTYSAPTGLKLVVQDSAGTNLYSQDGTKYASGSMSSPLASVASSGGAIEVILENQTGGTLKASARVSYTYDS